MTRRFTARLLLPLLGAACIAVLKAQDAPERTPEKNPIPEDVVGDEHVREEFGVNQFTTPSIRKLFDMLKPEPALVSSHRSVFRHLVVKEGAFKFGAPYLLRHSVPLPS